MPIEEIERGTGITKRKVRRQRFVAGQPPTPEDMEWRAQALKYQAQFAHLDAFDYRFGRNIELLCRREFERAGLSVEDQDITNLVFLQSIRDQQPGIEEDSRLDYAIRLAQHLGFVRMFIGKDDATEAAVSAIELGATAMEADMKFKWERPALEGRKISLGRKRGSQVANSRRILAAKPHRDRWRKAARSIWTNHPTWSVSQVARNIAKNRENWIAPSVQPSLAYIRQTIAHLNPRPK